MGSSSAVEKTEEELHRQLRQITERLRVPRGLGRGGSSAAATAPRNFASNGARHRGFVRPADRNEAGVQPPAKRRLLSAVVKVEEDAEIIEDPAFSLNFCSVVLHNEAMEGCESQDKASWTKDMLHTFCDICIEAIDKGMRPNTHFNKNGWKYVMTTFKAMTGRSFTKQQLKNKWDGAKKDWRIWKKLIADISVGWNSKIGTISASDEWWKAKIKEIRGARKFRHAGIEPYLCSKFDRMFSNIVATGQYAWAPSSGVLFDDDSGEDESGDDAANLEEESGHLEEDVILNFVDDVSNMVAGVNVANSSGKRKHKEHSTQQGGRKGKNGSGIGAQLCSLFDQLIDIISTKSECTFRDKKGCSIEEVMAELHSIDGIIRGDNFYCYALKFFCSRSKREMWSAMGDLDTKLKWLKMMYERSLRSSK